MTDLAPVVGHSSRGVPGEVAEAALARKVRNPIETAYRRTDLLARRRRLMDDWAAYLASG